MTNAAKYVTGEAKAAARDVGGRWRGGSDDDYYAGMLEAAAPHIIAAAEADIRADENAKVQAEWIELVLQAVADGAARDSS